MNNKVKLILLLSILINVGLIAQDQHFIIKIAPFSSQTNDEFSPVFYKDGIVFCSNQGENSLIGYKNGQDRLFKIFYVTKNKKGNWKLPKLLAKEISTHFNDGPVTLNEIGNIIYYSRNNSIENSLKNISNPLNKIGIYSAEFIDGKWTNVKPFTYNNPLYSFGTPALAPNGKRIYFSSDMPGGYGGMDLYYCNMRNNGWDPPVNLGPIINTQKDESYPFVDKSDKLFFASDGLKGLGGKDLFYTLQIDKEWQVPVHLDSNINSTADDFGLVTDSDFENGYFSSNRQKTDDIYSFNSMPFEFEICDSIKENKYCFTFYDEQYPYSDSTTVSYVWDFGNGIKLIGKEVKHCFPGPGKYIVNLNITDKLTGKAIAENVEYNVELKDTEQANITSYNVGLVGKPMDFDGLKTNLNNFEIANYLWNFGEGFKAGNPSIIKTFKKKGKYLVQMGLISKIDSLGMSRKTCVMKEINIYDTYEKLQLRDNYIYETKKSLSTSEQVKTLQIRIYLMDDLSDLQKVKIKAEFKETS